MNYNHVIQQCIIPQLQITESKKQEIPQDMLGRMLAYSCFMPRLFDIGYLYENFRYVKNDLSLAHKGLCINPSNLPKLLQDCNILHSALSNDIDDEILCVLLDSIPTYIYSDDSLAISSPCASMNLDSSLEDYTLLDCIGILRRLSPAFIAQGGVILEAYQILESAVAGADMVVLDLMFLRSYALFVCMINESLDNSSVSDDNNHVKLNFDSINEILSTSINPKNYKYKNVLLDNLNSLIALATNLGLVPIIRIQAKEDLSLLLGLKQAIDCVIVPTSFIPLLPNSYLIFSYASYFHDTGFDSANMDLEMNLKFNQFCLNNPSVDMVIEPILH